MKNPAAVFATEVAFAKQLNGYDRQQVDRYIDMLAQEYQGAYDNLSVTSSKYNSLLEEYSELEKQVRQNRLSADAIARTLTDAEIMAQNILESANTEAEKIKAEAKAEAEKIKGDACIEKLAAKRSIETANEYLAQTMSKLQSLCVS